MGEYIIGEVDDSLTAASTSQGGGQAPEDIGPKIAQIKSEYEILSDSEIEEKYRPDESSDITIGLSK